MRKLGNILLGILTMWLLFGLLVAVNYLGSILHIRHDFTADGLYTLSPESREILQDLEAPVTIRFYYRRGLTSIPGNLKSYATQVEDLLEEYKIAGGGNIVIEKYDPAPDSKAEDSAVLDEIDRLPMRDGQAFYLGLAVNRADLTETLGYLAPDKANTLEYEITRAISRVANPTKPKIGILSSLSVFGQQPQGVPWQQQQGQPAWALVDILKMDYEVENVPVGTDRIPDDLTALVLIHPKNLTPRTLYALDQYLLRGGNLLAFLDPLSAIDRNSNPMARFQPSPPSDLGPLTKAWGIDYDPSQLVADRQNAFPVPGGRKDYAVMFLRDTAMPAADVATSGLNLLVYLYGGSFSGTPAEGLEKTVLLESTELSQVVDSQTPPQVVFDEFEADSQRHALAIRLQGSFPTAFPDGPPSPPAEGGEAVADPGLHLGTSATPGNVVLVGDADMLHDSVWTEVQTNPFTGDQYRVIRYDNFSLLQNCLDQLSGDPRLIGIRAKNVTLRPFTLIQEMEAKADEKYNKKIKELEDQQQETLQELQKLLRASKEDAQHVILSAEAQEQITNLREKKQSVAEELKEMRNERRANIRALETKLRVANFVAVPALVILIGLAVALFRFRS